ncbi:hypothetical protein ACJIZ3_006727 [Penstemon smallii]|uniref:Cation-transporting P-type ATPase C-terminal domain-containing protein n=1 Tax=Penstemon smallii TaxID=265156 RepID=A0ABD3S8Y6_9LAMI
MKVPRYFSIYIIFFGFDAGTVAAIEISEDDIAGDQNVLSLHSSSEQEHNIELQYIQRNNITKIVKDKNLQALNTTALSLTFGIKQQGLAVNGWIDGTVRNYLREKSSVKKLETYWLPNGRGGGHKGLHSSCNNLKAQVTRGVHLKKGSLIPADGIYVAGESLQVDGELKSTIVDETNPFLFYGSRVINGNGSMIVTSVGVDMVWGEMMSQAVALPANKCKFAACFDKMNIYIQISGILIGILINTSLFMASVTTIFTDKLGGLMENEHEIDMFLVGEELISESSQVASPDLLEGSINEQCKILNKYGIGGNPFEENSGLIMEKIGYDGRSLHLHYKGPPLEILSLCSKYYDSEGNIHAIDVQKRSKFENVIRYYLVELEMVAFACIQIVNESDDASVLEANSLTLLGMIALKYTKKEEIKKAVLTLKEGGIRTVLASGDDVAVLQTIGEKCGLISPNSDDLVLTAEEYRAWNDEQKKDRVGKIRIIGNCLPSDKIDLVKFLKETGEVVAVLGQQTLDAPALKVADIGVTFGSWSSEVARECSGISIFHGDFSFLVHVIEKGKGFHENTRKFTQLQLIFTVSSLLINFIATVLWGDAPLTTIQLIWLNLVLVFVGGLAVLTGQPIGMLMDIVPIKSYRRLITKAMYRNIFIQALYQTIVLLTLQCKGQSIFGTSDAIVKSMIYKGFCLCQFFNIFIAREHKSKNIFKGLFQKNGWFFVALVLFVLFQAAFFVAEKFLGGTPFLNCKLFGVCLLIGLVSWLLDSFGKFISSLIARWAANLASG